MGTCTSNAEGNSDALVLSKPISDALLPVQRTLFHTCQHGTLDDLKTEIASARSALTEKEFKTLLSGYDSRGWNAAHCAAIGGRSDNLRHLKDIKIKKGAGVDVMAKTERTYTPWSKGCTILHLACYNGDGPCTQLALDWGLKITDNQPFDILQQAVVRLVDCREARWESTHKIQSLALEPGMTDCLQILLISGADPKKLDAKTRGWLLERLDDVPFDMLRVHLSKVLAESVLAELLQIKDLADIVYSYMVVDNGSALLGFLFEDSR